jgi:4-diphosphocytidyl-2-C-methyl-D-erythritol kinase
MYVEAPCKVNLHLRILEKRSDGFHNLESVFALLAFGDSLEVSVLPGGSGVTSLIMEPESGSGLFWNEMTSLPPEKNIVYRAASLFREQTGFDGDLSVKIRKSVPPGSGLGGGSSDAAAALFAFNCAAGKPLSPEKLLVVAARLGSDVPFFLSGGTAAWVSGRGERLEPLFPPFSGYGVLLVFPGFQSVTAEAYDFLDKNRENGVNEAVPAKDELIAALEKSPSRWPFKNDFLSAFLENGGDRGDCYASILGSLEDSGALFRGLSGSGSACFGVYRSEEDAERAKIDLETKYCVQNTNFLALRPFWH